LYGPPGEESFSVALESILEQLDSSLCRRLGFLKLHDKRLQKLLAAHAQSKTQVAFEGTPLASLTGKALGSILNDLAAAIELELVSQTTADGKPCEEQLDTPSSERKAAKLGWNKRNKYWLFQWNGVQCLSGSPGAAPRLTLSLYSPRGIYFFRHDLSFGVSTQGVRTNAEGHYIQLCGTQGVENWDEALDAMLEKLDADTNGCKRLAFMPFHS